LNPTSHQHDENSHCEEGYQNHACVELHQPHVGTGQPSTEDSNVNWTQRGSNDAMSQQKKHLVAANQLPQQSLAPEVT